MYFFIENIYLKDILHKKNTEKNHKKNFVLKSNKNHNWKIKSLLHAQEIQLLGEPLPTFISAISSGGMHFAEHYHKLNTYYSTFLHTYPIKSVYSFTYRSEHVTNSIPLLNNMYQKPRE